MVQRYDVADLFRPSVPTTHGSAAWAMPGDFEDAGLLKPGTGKMQGPVVGYFAAHDTGSRRDAVVYAPGEGHLLTVAPTRSGKGRGQIITNLLSWSGSAVVIDIKGENWERTAKWRESQGHRVIKFAPFDQDGETWNPILEVVNDGCGPGPDDPRREENARYLTNMMITPNPQANNPYWDNASRTLLQGLILYVATAELAPGGDAHFVRERTMAEVRRLLMLEPTGFNAMTLEMLKSPENLVRESAATLAHMLSAKEQYAGLKTTLMEHTSVWGFSRLRQVSRTSSFSFKMLRDERPTTIYIVIPPEALHEYRSLLRILIGSCMKGLRESFRDDDAVPVLFLLDEFPQLAYMRPIEEALLYTASYGVKFWFFVQDISQLRQHYEKTWQQFIANCSVRSFFGINDLETAKYVSEMSGLSTVRNHSFNAGRSETYGTSNSHTSGTSSTSGYSSGQGGGSSSSSSGSSSSDTYGTSESTGHNIGFSVSFTGRALLLPDEVLRIPFGSAITFFKGMAPFYGRLKFWDEDRDLAPRCLPPPK